MKKLLLALPLICFASCLYAQKQTPEEQIKKLEQTEVAAILARDTTTLKKLWDKDYVVNNPENRITFAKPNSVDRPVLHKERSTFIREVEHVTINGNVAISMGSETVVPSGDAPNAGQTEKRRYTNIWKKAGDSWKLIGRHANAICPR